MSSYTKQIAERNSVKHTDLCPPGYEDLSVEQRYAFAKFKEGHNLFITGPGGTGKTRLIQYLVDYMKMSNGGGFAPFETRTTSTASGIAHQVCALTGCAAVLLNCGAKTIHSWSGIRLGKGPKEDIVRRVIKNRFAIKSWRESNVLIVDEISMMSAKMFELLDEIGRLIRRNTKPFGGIQLVFTGDFFQLPPISDSSDPTSSLFCFESPKWPHVFARENCIQLTTYFRQSDPKYIEILQQVRTGKLSEENTEILQKCVHRVYSPGDHGGIVPTKLFPVRQKVDYVNATMYASLEQDEITFSYTSNTDERFYLESATPIPYELLEKCRDMSKAEIDFEIEQILSSTQTEKQLNLKIGAAVMCTTNLNVDAGICNGSQGIIVEFSESSMRQSISISNANKMVPVVRFANGRTVKIEPYIRQSDDYPTIVVAQIPLCLAWALTIHKIQGSTLQMAEMDIGKSVFEYGQTYVALSRIKSLDGLYLSEFNPHRIKSNPDVIAFYESFPKRSREEMEEATNSIKTPNNAILEEEPYLDPNIKRIRL
jgi:ATP-dependent DNA helicase PIF1